MIAAMYAYRLNDMEKTRELAEHIYYSETTVEESGAKHTVIISEIISICILSVVFVFAKSIVAAFGLGSADGYCFDIMKQKNNKEDSGLWKFVFCDISLL